MVPPRINLGGIEGPYPFYSEFGVLLD